MRWRLILVEISLEVIYSKGSKNIVADTLCCLDKIDYLSYNSNNNYKVEPTSVSLSEYIAYNKEDVLHPTSFKTIMRFLQKNKYLIEIAK